MANWIDMRKARRPKKMGNESSICALGHSHRSKLESAVCQLIQLRTKAGDIELIQAEATVYLSAARIKYIADFRCRDLKTGEELYIEAKGFANDRWPILKKLWEAYGPAKLEVWKGTHARPYLDETIIPKGNA